MGRHALLEAPDVSETTLPAAAPGEVRTVAEIIAAFRREQEALDAVLPTPAATVTPAASTPAGSAPATSSDDDVDPGAPAAARRAAAWDAALATTAGGSTPQPRRRRAAGNAGAAGASAVIASLTAELATTHPGLLDGSPHSRRAAAPARRTAAAGSAATLRPVRVSGGLRGAALRVPALTGGWRLPARTPLLLAGVVAASVVVTDQAGLLTPSDAAAGDTAAAADLTAAAAANPPAADSAAPRGAADAQTRVSRLERSPLTTADPSAVIGATAAGTGTAIAAAPPPDSVMKPGQTIPGDWVRPSPTGTYTSCFCARWGTFHEGIDFGAPLGSPVLAVGDGVVVQAGPASGFGNWVIIKHDNGDVTIYGHMRYFFVKVGQHVTAGQEIALVGDEGQSTGPHLHLGVKTGSTNGLDGTYIDPVPWLVARGVDVGTYNENG